MFFSGIKSVKTIAVYFLRERFMSIPCTLW
jgi:hypothetical protein